MLYDGDCPLCMREVNMLRERNKGYGSIKFVDISLDDYCPDDNQGLDYKTAFRRLYEVVGLGWVYAVTKYEPIASIADAVMVFGLNIVSKLLVRFPVSLGHFP
ncbi:uncharacterized protein at5g50100 mitochondrial [Phtheirospermum japonicum]|uniref:Uncharacterized protein at5g50100 mitochondrial n=1 Tax=Phtheirospermum japonicum TaxID=374723 RepID=A0A830B067_9LAMI|nr:uncharacterized protein at5g50100 mitochondrial [Phtheirospermum japonicum]